MIFCPKRGLLYSCILLFNGHSSYTYYRSFASWFIWHLCLCGDDIWIYFWLFFCYLFFGLANLSLLFNWKLLFVVYFGHFPCQAVCSRYGSCIYDFCHQSLDFRKFWAPILCIFYVISIIFCNVYFKWSWCKIAFIFRMMGLQYLYFLFQGVMHKMDIWLQVAMVWNGCEL